MYQRPPIDRFLDGETFFSSRACDSLGNGARSFRENLVVNKNDLAPIPGPP